MITRSHCKAAAIGLCLALPTFAQATQILIDEAFDGASVPDGWVFNGKQGTSHTNPRRASTRPLRTGSER
jgi:hypothetical protein